MAALTLLCQVSNKSLPRCEDKSLRSSFAFLSLPMVGRALKPFPLPYGRANLTFPHPLFILPLKEREGKVQSRGLTPRVKPRKRAFARVLFLRPLRAGVPGHWEYFSLVS